MKLLVGCAKPVSGRTLLEFESFGERPQRKHSNENLKERRLRCERKPPK